MGKGLYRDRAFVQVSYEGSVAVPISAALYQQRGYKPPLDKLPSKKKYEAQNA